jgi:hypothetical protein
MDAVGIVYIARGADLNWKRRIQRFATSFIKYPPGHPYQLYVIYKEFATPDDFAFARGIFSVVDHQEITDYIGWNSFGGGAFLEATNHVKEDLLCTLVSTTEVMHERWLGKLYRAFCLPGIGLVGCTGSKGFIREYFPELTYPNVHIRDTAIIVSRRIYSSIASQFDYKASKLGYLAFEHGPNGLTAQIRDLGLDVLVVEKDRVRRPEEWPETTYRGNLDNVMVHDRGARDFQDL